MRHKQAERRRRLFITSMQISQALFGSTREVTYQDSISIPLQQTHLGRNRYRQAFRKRAQYLGRASKWEIFPMRKHYKTVSQSFSKRKFLLIQQERTSKLFKTQLALMQFYQRVFVDLPASIPPAKNVIKRNKNKTPKPLPTTLFVPAKRATMAVSQEIATTAPSYRRVNHHL